MLQGVILIGMKLFLPFLGLLLATPVFAALSYGSGVYTNLCGTGFAATANTCNRGCNTGNGTCSAGTSSVVKYTCDGRVNECRNNESSFSSAQSLAGTACGKTVQIDVFDKTCRQNGNWTCNEANLKDYMVWYSGDCAPLPSLTPTKTPTQIPTKTPTSSPSKTPTPTPTVIIEPTTCDSLTIVRGNNAFAPETVTLSARASDPHGAIQRYRFFFGDSKQEESTNNEISHRYESGGSFSARVEALDSRGAWITSNTCQTTVTLKSLPIEGHKAECAGIFIREGNYTQAPTRATFEVIGFDNKGSIQQYKVDFGQGLVRESGSNSFQQVYDTPGTYTIRGYIKDSQGNWTGNTDICTKQLYINTKPLTTQPSTGTPTSVTIFAIGSGVLGLLLFLTRKLAFRVI